MEKTIEALKIAALLSKALLQDGEMAQALYEYELTEHIDYWYKGLKADLDDFVFIVTINSGHVAMVLITKNKTIFINEKAREKLQEMWPETYATNIKQFIPIMADQLVNDILPVTGVKIATPKVLSAMRKRKLLRR